MMFFVSNRRIDKLWSQALFHFNTSWKYLFENIQYVGRHSYWLVTKLLLPDTVLILLFQWWWWQKPVCLRFHPLLRLKLCLFSFAMNFLLLISQLDDWLKLARSHMCYKESFSYKHMKQPPRKFLGRCDEDSIKRGNGRNVEFLSRLSHYKASYFLYFSWHSFSQMKGWTSAASN